MIGATANTSWLPPALERDAKGYIYTGRNLTAWPLDREPFPLETSPPGVFCAGDVRHGSIKRVASAVGEGSMSIAFIHQYLALTGGLILPAFEIPRPFGLRRATLERAEVQRPGQIMGEICELSRYLMRGHFHCLSCSCEGEVGAGDG